MFDAILPEPAATFKKLYQDKLRIDKNKNEPRRPLCPRSPSPTRATGASWWPRGITRSLPHYFNRADNMIVQSEFLKKADALEFKLTPVSKACRRRVPRATPMGRGRRSASGGYPFALVWSCASARGEKLGECADKADQPRRLGD